MGVLPVGGSPGLHLNRALGGSASNATGDSSFFFLDNLPLAIPLGACLSTLSLLTFLGNAMVVHAIRTERKLHTVSNMFILSLAVADLTVGLVVMPVAAVYVLLGDWSLGLAVCQLWLVADYTASTASILNLLILSLDRYWSIRSPLAYLAQRTKKRALAMIALVWALSALWAIPIIGWHQWYNGGIRKHPSHVCETEFSDSVAFKLTTSLANFIVPMCLMVGLYCQIFREIKRRGHIGEIGRSISRVSCAAHRNGTTTANGTHSLTDGSFHTTSSTTNNSSGRRFFLKMRHKNDDEDDADGHHRPGHRLLQRILRPLIKRDSFASQMPHLPVKDGLPPLTDNHHQRKTTTVTANPMGGTGDLEPERNSRIFISSPTPPPQLMKRSDSKEYAQQGRQLAPLLRDLRLEQLSRDNGHRILKMLPQCKKCTGSSAAHHLQHNFDQLLAHSCSNSVSSNCTRSREESGENCDISSPDGPSEQRHTSRCSSVHSNGSVNFKGATPSRISSSASSLTSPTLSSSSSSPSQAANGHQLPSRGPFEHSHSLATSRDNLPPNTPTSPIDPSPIVYYRELTLMSVQPHSPVPSSVNSSEVNLSEIGPGSTKVATTVAQSKSYSSDLSNSSGHSKNLYSLQGDHFAGVNVTVEYIDNSGGVGEKIHFKENCTGNCAENNATTEVKESDFSAICKNNNKVTTTTASGLTVTTTTTTMATAQNIPEIESVPQLPPTESSSSVSTNKENSFIRKDSNKRRKSKKMKKSPSTISPNSDEIRKESLGIERDHSSGSHGKANTCAMCGSSLSKSISQASMFSNVIIEKPSDSGSVKTTASAQPALQGATNSLMCVPKHSTPMNSFSNLPVLYGASGKPLHPSAAQLSKNSSWRSYSSFSFSKHNYFGRSRADSLAVPANEFCEECACMASAVSAAARHRHALRREESSRLRQEKKAARQLGVILGAFILCWMPYIITYVVTAYCAHCVSLTVHQVTIWLGYLNSFLNPFLYALCNENFKHAFKKMLGRMPPPSHMSYNYDQQTIANTGTVPSANGTTGGAGGSGKGAMRGGGGGKSKIEPKLSLMKMCSVLLVFAK